MKPETHKKCILYDKLCTNCGECEMCDLDPDKVCDSCGKCLNMDEEFREFKLDLLNIDEFEHEEYNCACGHNHSHSQHSHENCDCGCENDDYEEYELDLGNLNDEDLSYLDELLEDFDISDYEELENINFGSEIIDDFDDFDDDFEDYINYDDCEEE